ncbi:NrdH [Mycobacterium phage SirDuracell]|uniref:NrdH n=4 Tax=Kostyavirus TaxID=1623284 RepID=G1D5Q0_9CAUD|nr:hypothetical protein SEA_DUSK_35 [Mycobacterium phage Dusk]YP_009225323.1 hypothetical protein SEA_MINDY_36 [Mycobacterium phage Mindy]YP_009607965.1 NrdH [Mycobacterium phage SirDuracell]AEK08888.1 hypothetical protein PBI_HENRY_37 [Mycobacterium phage Henry]ATW59584.1 hypothetical protein SEA_YOUNGBLOOD_36 [Mycobacterium phage Youngblood]AXH49854.1 hypothetical protein SEA_GLEXAN_34 [Mycobacterium phage Glexan]AYR00152.1 hypothetical protein PBI_PAT3_35 [Mycobacterium phage Pat3]QAY0656
MTGEWITVVAGQWPWLILVAVFIMLIPQAVKAIETVKGLLAPLFERLTPAAKRKDRRDDINAKVADLEAQVTFLTEQVANLRARDRMYWAWVISDQEWHRKVELEAAERGWELPHHVSFDEFYDEWIIQHPIPRPYQL